MKVIPCNSIQLGAPFYILDSNTYIEFARFYYNGKCSSAARTDFVRFLLLHAREMNASFLYDISGNETAFDYGLNGRNDDSWEQVFTAVDSLITKIPTESIIRNRCSVKKTLYPYRETACTYYSVFETAFPQTLFPDPSFRNIFYLSYLYRIKIQELYQNKTLSPIERIENLFDYMTSVIGIFGDIEFQLAKMLFIGQGDVQTAKKLLKVDEKINVALLNNSVLDIVQFRIARIIGTYFPNPVFYVTGDKGLQRIFELNKALISSSCNLASVSEDMSDIRSSAKKNWQELYERKIYPVMKEKFVMSHFIQRDFDSVISQIKNEIILIEQIIIKPEQN